MTDQKTEQELIREIHAVLDEINSDLDEIEGAVQPQDPWTGWNGTIQ